MSPLTELRAIRSELQYDSQQLASISAAEHADQKFYESLAKIDKKVLADRHEEDLLALQAIENSYCYSVIGLKILMQALILKEDLMAELLDCAKKYMPEENYLFLMELLKGFGRLPEEPQTVLPSRGEP